MISDQPFHWLVEDFVFLRDKAFYLKPINHDGEGLFQGIRNIEVHYEEKVRMLNEIADCIPLSMPAIAAKFRAFFQDWLEEQKVHHLIFDLDIQFWRDFEVAIDKA